jgi:murein DD-endopeptidase MepM/ murein hydrolase activator NlpD
VVAVAAAVLPGYLLLGHGGAATAAASAERPSPDKGFSAACPTAGRVTSGYGPRWGTFHDGVDLAAPVGTPIRAVLPGTVTHSGDDDPGGYGSYVELAHGDGTVTQYGHVSARLVRTGQRVRAGQVIARVGNEGESTGPHLHFRVRPHPGRGVDPVPWLRARGVRLPCG